MAKPERHDHDGTEYTSLSKLEPNRANDEQFLMYVLRKLEEAEQLKHGLCWKCEIWDGVTVEELIGGLLVADHKLVHEKIELARYAGADNPYEMFDNIVKDGTNFDKRSSCEPVRVLEEE